MKKIHDIILDQWYLKPSTIISQTLINIFLIPFSFIFYLIINIRIYVYKFNTPKKIPVPVVVVGNITVGGSGKTRLCLFLVKQLKERGIEAAVILRGYGGTNTTPKMVNIGDSPDEVGDESLIYASHGIPVACGSDRHQTAMILLATKPKTQIIISDDGLQHYKLARDFEICVVDAVRLFGNQYLLPNGPLREPLNRLKRVNAFFLQAPEQNNETIIQKAEQKILKYKKPIAIQKFKFLNFYNPSMKITKSEFSSETQKIFVISALGDNKRFINYVSRLPVPKFTTLSFNDHYSYQESDLPTNGMIITTEKDYVKMTKFNRDNIWIVQIDLHVDEFTSIIASIVNLIK